MPISVTFVLTVVFTLIVSTSNAEDVSFRRDIAPILLSNCVACHNPQTAEGDYRINTFAALSKKGDSDLPPINTMKSESSELLRRVVTSDEDERMPAESDALPSVSVGLIRRWIEQGARYDADDPQATLASILPIAKHPPAPASYRFPVPLTAVSLLGNDVVVGGYHELIRWSVADQKLVQRIGQVGERIYSISYDEQRERLYVASGSPGKLGEVRILDATDGTLVGVPLVSNEVFLDIALHPNGNLLAAAGGDRKLYVIDVRSMQQVKTFDSHSDWIRAVAWSDDGERLATASRDKTVKLFSLDTDNPLSTYAGHGEDVVDVCFVPGKKYELISCNSRGGVHLSTMKNDDKGKKFKVGVDEAYRIEPDGDGFWLSSERAVAKLSWTGAKFQKQRTVLPGLGIAVDANRLVLSNAKGNVLMWKKDESGKTSSKQKPIEISPLTRTD